LLGINQEILKDAEATGKISKSKGLRLWGRYGRPIHKALQYSMDPYIPDVSGSESGAVQILKEVGIELKDEKGGWRTLSSLNHEEIQKLSTGMIKARIHNGEDNPEWIFGDVYELMDKSGGFRDANEFATMLNACGKSGNAWIGVGICLNDEGFSGDIEKAMASYRREIGRAVELVRKNKDLVRMTGYAHFILAGSRISEHIISNVASIVEKSAIIVGDGKHKPLFALANAEDGQVKVSGRASDHLVKEGLNMKDIMARIAEEFGGQGGGHAGAGGATIPAGTEERFINTVEKLLIAPGTSKTDDNINSQAHKIEDNKAERVHSGAQQPIRNRVEGERVAADAKAFDSKALTGDHHGSTEVKGTGTEGKEEGREGSGQGREGQGETSPSPVSKKMEGKGLVRYLFS
jgi:RecJ-like exonuclease